MISTEQGSDSKHQETNKKVSRRIHKETKQKREDRRDHENQQIHGREEASTWDRGCPTPAARCKCHTIRGWPHQITFLYTKEIPSKTELSPCLHLNRDGVRMEVVLDGKVGWRWEVGRGISFLTYFLSFTKPFRFYVNFLLAQDSSPLSASKGGSYLTTSQQYTRAALSLGEDGHVAITLASKVRQGLQDRNVCHTCPLTLTHENGFHGVISLVLSCGKKLMASDPPKRLNTRAPRAKLWWRGKGLTS